MCNVCVLCERFQPSYIRAYMQTHRPTDRRTDRQTCTTSSSPASFMREVGTRLSSHSINAAFPFSAEESRFNVLPYAETYIYTLYVKCRYLFVFIIAYTYKHIAEHTHTHTHTLRACGHNHAQRSTCDVGLKLYLIRAAAFVILKFNWGFESNL